MTEASCRPRLDCGSSPDPPEATNLEKSETSADLKEHQSQEYNCKEGFSLTGLKHELISEDFKVELPCITDDISVLDENGKVKFLPPNEWKSPLEWPTCLEIVEECTELPNDLDDFVNVTSLPVAVGQTLTFTCKDLGTIFRIF